DVDEQPRPRGRGAPPGPRGLRRHGQGGPKLAKLRRHREHAAGARVGRDAGGPVRQAGCGLPHPALCAAGPHLELDAGAEVGRLETRYLDRMAASLDEAVRWAEEARESGTAVSIGVVGNAAEVYRDLLRRGFQADAVTDQTSAHDPLGGYVPAGLSPAEAEAL